ncbi:chorismate mutase [Pseudomonas sp. RIT-PI-S]|uniref:chorismate mutase n=1 Tax=Pseudomonas sp. RIT-PI-S TaxID=3035295 RepID=UPI0021D7E423|nr:chorismate mutase [Pseudomonas sp. RIT-PI-S]
MLRSFVPCLVLAASLVGSSAWAAEPAPAAFEPLLASIEQRLNIADQVALSKWDSKKAVEDRAREREVIAAAVLLAPQYKLEPAFVEQFFAAQIEANKLVQYGHLAEWRLAGAAPDTPRPDLVGQIRPQLDTLQKTLMEQLAAFAGYRNNAACPLWVAQASNSGERDELHRLALIRATGELCVTPH